MKSSPHLVRAVHARDVRAVRSILAQGADPNSAAKDGTPVLHTAACIAPDAGMPIFEALVAAGARLDLVDRAGWLPIKAATWCGNEPAVRRLLELGADPDADSGDGRGSSLSLAVFKGRPGVIQALLPRYHPPFDPMLLCTAAGHAHVEAVALLLRAGAAPDGVNSMGDIPLHAALKSYDREELPPEEFILAVVETLLAAGANPRLRDADGNDSLALARRLGYPKVLTLIEEFTS